MTKARAWEYRFALAILALASFLRMGVAMITKRTVDRVGGVGSILVGVVCAGIGFWDWQLGHSLWKAWAVMFVVLVLNGAAMLRVARRSGLKG